LNATPSFPSLNSSRLCQRPRFFFLSSIAALSPFFWPAIEPFHRTSQIKFFFTFLLCARGTRPRPMCSLVWSSSAPLALPFLSLCLRQSLLGALSTLLAPPILAFLTQPFSHAGQSPRLWSLDPIHAALLPSRKSWIFCIPFFRFPFSVFVGSVIELALLFFHPQIL